MAQINIARDGETHGKKIDDINSNFGELYPLLDPSIGGWDIKDEDTTCTDMNTYYNINGMVVNPLSKDFILESGTDLKYTGAKTKKFLMIGTAYIAPDQDDRTLHTLLEVNGIAITETPLYFEKKEYSHTLSKTYTIELAQNDIIRLKVKSATAGTVVTFHYFYMTFISLQG